MFSYAFEKEKWFCTNKKAFRDFLLNKFGSYGEILSMMMTKTLQIEKHGIPVSIEDADDIFNLELFE